MDWESLGYAVVRLGEAEAARDVENIAVGRYHDSLGDRWVGKRWWEE